MPLKYQDPVHGQIFLPDRFQSLIESRALGRLRNIKQLGLTVSRYPGAVHSRFEHTLGTAAVASDFLEALGSADTSTVGRVTLACLLSEIGIMPLSYSTRQVFQAVQLDKNLIRAAVYRHSLDSLPGVMGLEGAGIATVGSRLPLEAWDSILPHLGGFGYMDFVKLASTVDYVMRDAHYCGRAHGGFDYRRFRVAMGRAHEAEETDELFDELQALHRAVHSLNAVYGDSDRRVLTVVMNRLALELLECGALSVGALTDPGALVELDDDQFLGDIIEATEIAASGAETAWCQEALNVVGQRGECQYLRLDETVAKEDMSAEDAAGAIADDMGIPAWRVVVLGGEISDGVGFRMFGSEFPSLSAAMESELFAMCTGLDVGRIRRVVNGPARAAIVGI